MHQSEIDAILTHVRQIDNRTKAIEAGVNTIIGLLVVAGVIVLLFTVGIWPALILAIAAVGTWAGRDVQRRAQK